MKMPKKRDINDHLKFLLAQNENIENPLTWLGYHPSQDKVVRQEFIIKTAIPKLTKVEVVNCLNQLIRSVESLPYAHWRHELIQEMKRDLNLVVTQRISRDRDITPRKGVNRRPQKRRNPSSLGYKRGNKKNIEPPDPLIGDWRG